MEHWTEYTRFITALLVILDPFAAVPIYLLLTKSYLLEERNRVARLCAITVMAVLVAAALLGEKLLLGLGTSLASFRIAGGLILLLMALKMLQAKSDFLRSTPAETAEAEDRHAIAVVPLAIPLLAGPGSISTVIIEIHRSEAQYHGAMVILCILVAGFLLWSVLRLAVPIGEALGQTGLNIITRLFGLVLAAIAIETLANGLKQLFPLLSG
jgi:MarC family membrane protein